MNVYEVITRVIDTQYDGVDVRTINQSICILAENLIEVAEVVKHDKGELLAINEIAVVPGHLNSRYKVVPRTESDLGEVEPAGAVDLGEVEDKLKDVKHRLVHKRDYENASLVREVQSTIRTLKGEPRTLDELQASTESEEYCTDGCHTWYRKKNFCFCKTCGKPVKSSSMFWTSSRTDLTPPTAGREIPGEEAVYTGEE